MRRLLCVCVPTACVLVPTTKCYYNQPSFSLSTNTAKIHNVQPFTLKLVATVGKAAAGCYCVCTTAAAKYIIINSLMTVRIRRRWPSLLFTCTWLDIRILIHVSTRTVNGKRRRFSTKDATASAMNSAIRTFNISFINF